MILQQRPLCLYHKNCLDGIAAAWCAWKFHDGNIDLQAIQYGDPIPVVGGQKVYVLDFSFNAEKLVEIDQMCDLVLLDHHDTAAREFEKVDASKLRGSVVVDEEHSGAMLAWHYFFPDQTPPMGIEFVQDRDMWAWAFEGTRDWTSAAYSYPFDVELFDQLIERDFQDVIQEGRIITWKTKTDVDKIAKAVRTMVIDGVVLPVINANSLFASDLGHKLSEGYPAAVVYVDGNDGRIFSLRARNGGLAVNQLAERFGGGGHPGAAGFKIKFTDRRFKNSHLYLYSKGYWWKRLKGLLGFSSPSLFK